jgi:hypothetical protein
MGGVVAVGWQVCMMADLIGAERAGSKIMR